MPLVPGRRRNHGRRPKTSCQWRQSQGKRNPSLPFTKANECCGQRGIGKCLAPLAELPLARLTAPGGEGETGLAEPGRFGKRPAAPEPDAIDAGKPGRWDEHQARTRHLVDQYTYMRRVSPNVNGALTLPRECCHPRITGDYPAHRCLGHCPRPRCVAR
jgi:hypothetical protein